MFRLLRHSSKQIRTVREFSSKLNRGIAPIIFHIHFQRAVLEYDIIQRRKILVGKLRMADKVLNRHSVFCVQLIDIYPFIYQYQCQFYCLFHNVLRARKQNVEQRFRDVGFDGFVCGCGTDIYCDGAEILHVAQTHETVMKLLLAAREWDIDILFESRKEVAFDLARPLRHPDARRQYEAFEERGYEMPEHLENPNFFCDKFVLWFEHPEQLAGFRTTSDRYFECIDRGGNFREFVPLGYSKATGLNYVLDYYRIDKKDAYAFGDSNNDRFQVSLADDKLNYMCVLNDDNRLVGVRLAVFIDPLDDALLLGSALLRGEFLEVGICPWRDVPVRVLAA